MLSTYYADALLGQLSSASRYLALVTEGITRDGAGVDLVEPSYGGYHRVTIAPADWAAPADSRMVNANAINLAPASSGADLIVGWAICDAQAVHTGQVLHYGEVRPFEIDTSDPSPRIPAGRLVVVFAGPLA